MRKIGFAVIAAAALAAAPAGAQEMPDARELVDRYVEAIGGRGVARSFDSRTLKYRMEIEAGTVHVEIRMRRPNLGVTRMSTPAGEVRTGTDGGTVWVITPAGAQVQSGMQAEEVRIRTAFDADVLLDVYPTMETVGREQYGGRPCWKVRMLTAVTGTESFRCFDVETGLIVAVIETRSGVPTTAVVEEYREFDGLKFPARTVATGGGRRVSTTLLEVSHAEIPLSAFEVPAEVRALRQ
ncbi:MAG TPA: hypothetical protein VFQ45_12030 [Longimicrobium sp.]|nr:hypothetical protein [Longimicrobium sp.]